jgi:hypothetical protein
MFSWSVGSSNWAWRALGRRWRDKEERVDGAVLYGLSGNDTRGLPSTSTPVPQGP